MTTPNVRPALTRQQARILDVLTAHITTHGYPPSVRELGDAAGLMSTSSVHHQLEQLARKGYIRRVPGRARALVIEEPAA